MQFKRDLIESDEFIVKAYDCLGKGEIERLNYSPVQNTGSHDTQTIPDQKQRRGNCRINQELFLESDGKYKLDYIKKEIKRIYELMEVPPHKAITSKTIEEFFPYGECMDWQRQSQTNH